MLMPNPQSLTSPYHEPEYSTTGLNQYQGGVGRDSVGLEDTLREFRLDRSVEGLHFTAYSELTVGTRLPSNGTYEVFNTSITAPSPYYGKNENKFRKGVIL
jgi:hypothetical protein